MIQARDLKALALATIGLFLIAALGCSADGTSKISKTTTVYDYQKGTGGSEVRYYEIEGHEHMWPGLSDENKKGDTDNSGIDATVIIRDFFSKF